MSNEPETGAASVPGRKGWKLKPGSTPLLISIPHAGTHIPEDIADDMTDAGRAVPDTDWHVDRLYAFATELGAGILKSDLSRYVVDLNRPADGQALYPGRFESGLCPVETFDGEPVYRAGRAPDVNEIRRRVDRYWKPYHQCLREELDALKQRHGYAVLWEAHSIRSRVPRLFDGVLPDLNFGTHGGRSSAPALAAALHAFVAQHGSYTAVLNGRFTGGYITRRYGDPERGVHAIQLEISQRTYMQESEPDVLIHERCQALQQVLEILLTKVLEHEFAVAPDQAGCKP